MRIYKDSDEAIGGRSPGLQARLLGDLVLAGELGMALASSSGNRLGSSESIGDQLVQYARVPQELHTKSYV
jgi:hypothetical protein